MPTFIYRCPKTGLKVQGWLAEAAAPNERDTYEAVTCTACNQTHLVNPWTGRTLGDGEGAANPPT
jgi:hypothetical protein